MAKYLDKNTQMILESDGIPHDKYRTVMLFKPNGKAINVSITTFKNRFVLYDKPILDDNVEQIMVDTVADAKPARLNRLF